MELPEQYPVFWGIFAEDVEKRNRRFQKLLVHVEPLCIASVKLLFTQPPCTLVEAIWLSTKLQRILYTSVT